MSIKNFKCLGPFFDGKFHLSEENNSELVSLNPGDLEATPLVFPFSFDQLNLAIESSKKAFSSWKRLKPDERKNHLKRYSEALRKNKAELTTFLSFETGKPQWESALEVDESLSVLDGFLKNKTFSYSNFSTENTEVAVDDRPLGTVAVISPPIRPLFNLHRLFVPSLLCGNVVVLKSSRFTPGVGQKLAEVFQAAELPAGIVNVVYGDEEMARRISTHSDIKAVFYSGTFETSLQLRKQLATDFNKMLVVETGGKNATLLWKDVEVDKVLPEIIFSSFVTAGQRTTSTHRLLVHDSIFDSFLEKFHAAAKKVSIGSAFENNKEPFMGPLLSEHALENYLRFQGIAVRENCEEIMRGKRLERKEKGFYVSPSIHWVQKPDKKSMYQKTEVFGPNVALYRVSDLAEIASIFNLPDYGLIASIYSKDKEVFSALRENVNAGLFYWNLPTVQESFTVPTLGLGKSGNFRPMGTFSAFQNLVPICRVESEQLKFKVPFSL